MSWLTALSVALTALGKALARVATNVLALLGAIKFGMVRQESEAQAKHLEQAQKDKQVYEADPNEYPDPYLRDRD